MHNKRTWLLMKVRRWRQTASTATPRMVKLSWGKGDGRDEYLKAIGGGEEEGREDDLAG